jgi:transcriptional regulator with XRE-family HTH domain
MSGEPTRQTERHPVDDHLPSRKTTHNGGEVSVTSRRGSPTLRRRQLGMELRRLREAAGVTIDQVAARLECSASKISRIETGQSGASPRDVRDIIDMYHVPAEEAEALLRIAREARQKGWWQLYGAVLTGAYVGLEAAADAIRTYEALVVPGLLQTEDYARTMIRAGRPDIDSDEVDKRVRVRMNRQSLLSQSDPLDLWVVLDEAVLHRPVGGRAVMRQQLERLVETAELPTVTLQVLPFAAGAHAGMDGTFTILLYGEDADQNLVFASNAAGGLFLEKDDELSRYAFIFDHLRASALRPEASVAMIAGLAKEM